MNVNLKSVRLGGSLVYFSPHPGCYQAVFFFFFVLLMCPLISVCSHWCDLVWFAGPPVGVGMNIDIASIDMVSEVNMVSVIMCPV